MSREIVNKEHKQQVCLKFKCTSKVNKYPVALSK